MSVEPVFRAIRLDRLVRAKPQVEKNGAVIYCRVSTEDQLKNFSIETQETDCRTYCQRHGYRIIRVFIEAESAKTTARPRFQEMLSYCAGNHADIGAVVVWSVSRFARNMRDHLNVREELRSNDIRLLSFKEEIDDRTAAGRLHENFLSLQAQYDNDQRSERTIAGMKTAMGAGKWCHQAPVGYVNADVPGGLSHDTKRAPIVLKAFELYGEGKYSKKAAHNAVTDMGLRTKGGKPLSAQTFDKLLRNPLYAGWITSSWGLSQMGAFEPIVSVELFNCVQERLSGKSAATRQTRTRQNAEFPLRVFIRCAECGRGLTGSFSTGRRGKRYPYYCCPKPGCRAVKLGRDNLHHDFHQLLYSLRPKETFMPLFREVVRDVWKQKHSEQEALLSHAEQVVASLESRNQKLVDLFIDGQIDKATYEDQRGRIGNALAKARACRLEGLLKIEQVEYLIEFAEWMLQRVAGIWNSASLANKLRVQEALFPQGLTISKDGIGTPLPTMFFKQFEAIPVEGNGLLINNGGGPDPRLVKQSWEKSFDQR
jgi:DNA invertase Pin-like site-specific DNA recombinase